MADKWDPSKALTIIHFICVKDCHSDYIVLSVNSSKFLLALLVKENTLCHVIHLKLCKAQLHFSLQEILQTFDQNCCLHLHKYSQI